MATVHPRVGGERLARRLSDISTRFIPAWAGNAGRRDLQQEPVGSSPRGRGTPHGRQLRIPAVHPRVGGERLSSRTVSARRSRFIPAWAGNATSSAACVRCAGSSPRGRGTHAGKLADCACRFIPAWAGNANDAAQLSRSHGSSPRGRGTPHRRGFKSDRAVHPRVGGERSAVDSDNGRSRFIPAWAGNAGGIASRYAARGRFIPAWAGNALTSNVRPCPASVHPRVGGERSAIAPPDLRAAGSSPRGRGTHV